MVVSESVVGDLDVLDTLELFQSTIYGSEALGISQSSCSRRYRSFSQQFDFGFDRVDGVYRATRNFDILAALRQATQKRRVRMMTWWGLGGLVVEDPAAADWPRVAAEEVEVALEEGGVD
jgi:hypothetical protein